MFADYLNVLQTTVKNALSDFRRTHHDNWQEHKQMFTEDQLVILTDLLVSPCYYAWGVLSFIDYRSLWTVKIPA